MNDSPKLYKELAAWWPLLSAPADYAGEARVFAAIFKKHSQPVKTILELGSGGGNNALHLKKDFDLTLSDLSEEMLQVSKKLNPECEHIQGDMRTIRVNKTFDGVFIHDAISYITNKEDLEKVFETAFLHLKKGGLALFAPDWVRENFKEYTEHGGEDGEGKSLRYLEWVYDPDPSDTKYNVEFALLLKEGKKVRFEQDHHEDGIFPKQTWLDLLRKVGFKNAKGVDDPLEPPRVLFVAEKN